MPAELRGYMIFPASSRLGYRGVGRNPFVIAVVDSEIGPNAHTDIGSAWQLYPAGWKRDAYKLYEENLADAEHDLLSSVEAAREIRRVIEPHVGPHEILACAIRAIGGDALPTNSQDAKLIGYDIAYTGGDFYSAVLNGLFLNPSQKLIAKYKSSLNDSGLFADISVAPEYCRAFKQEVRSEANSTFYVWALSAVED
jgi:hypothetical protein